MPSLTRILFIAPAILAAARGQGVINSAQGTKGSAASLPLQVVLTSSDANIINQTEIAGNVVNECGRTLLGGNIDIGQNTEDQLLNKTVTSVTKGSKVAVTINQINADGAGPYQCDLDLQSNADGTSGQTNLTVKETDNADGTISLAVTMPNNLACIGASTGNVCTVRCFNTAAAGPFGGCFAVQQTDVTANVNSANTITTQQTLEGVEEQIAENQINLPATVKANQDATSDSDDQVLAVDALLNIDSVAQATAGAALASTTSAAKAAKNTAATAKSGTGKGKGAAAAGLAAAAAKAAGKKGGKGARAFIA